MSTAYMYGSVKINYLILLGIIYAKMRRGLGRIIAIVASIVPLVIISLLLNVSVEDILAIGLLPFVVSCLIAVAKLFMQGLRFHYYVRSFVGSNVASIYKSVQVRMGSEFVTLTTPAYTGGEWVRVAWLHKNGVHSGKGLWIITIEIISDVLVGSTLAYIAMVVAFGAHNYVISTAILLITTPVFASYLVLLTLSAKRVIQMPRFTRPLLTRLFGEEKGVRWTNFMNDSLRELCEMSRIYLRRSSLRVFAIGLALTFAGASLHALTFMVIASAKASVGFFESLIMVAAAISIGTIPITPGGSGLTELGVAYYLNTFGVDPAAFGDVIVAWRIASYHVPLFVSWALLIRSLKG
ncbi:MAG: flippase-like domain-containing protein [Candidatus Nitrosocaldus sp.]|nr:flippase-like domain-containing protein [Candidatus Nitrosocaldus sp.]MDW8000219.1 lysylphosphatidylglycerol synthase transmembrane domain-containing protein [Candidatus Nitrosocaldus sp.]